MMLEKIKSYYSKKSKWSLASDIFFALLIVSLLIPTSRQFVLVGVKKLSLFNPGIVKEEKRSTLQRQDYQWKLLDKNERIVKLRDYKGKVIFLNFWATWCPPCIAEMPSVQKLYDQYKDNDEVAFILVSNEDRAVIDAFLQKSRLTLPVYQNTAPAPYILSSSSIPKTFIISKTGEIVVSKTGSARWHGEKMIQLINSLINEEDD